MTARFDVAARLAEGRPAVEDVQQYVWACRAVGYQQPDLTVHAAQLRDWYGTEDGMDLQALRSDCVALEAAARTSADALSAQERALSALATAWDGAGAEAAQDFLRRHADASASAAAAVRATVETLTSLSDELSRAVDGKVDSVLTIASRVEPTRAQWLAAAATVTTGAGDRAAASEMVEHSVKPFVDNVIRTDWLTAMRTAMASVGEAYQRAAAEISAEPRPVFEIPGDLGPTPGVSAPGEQQTAPAPAASIPVAAPAPAAATVPSAWSAPVAPGPAPGPPEPAPAPPVPAPAPPPLAPAALPVDQGLSQPALAAPSAPMPALGGSGSGLPGLGGGLSGLSGLGQQFADTLSALLDGGSAGDADLEPPDLEPPDLSDGPDEDDKEDQPDENADDGKAVGDELVGDDNVDGDGDAETADEPPADVTAEPAAGQPGTDGCDDEAVGAAETVAAPEPPPAPPPAEPLPPAAPAADAAVAADGTPCAIAAGEVPQVGPPPG